MKDFLPKTCLFNLAGDVCPILHPMGTNCLAKDLKSINGWSWIWMRRPLYHYQGPGRHKGLWGRWPGSRQGQRPKHK